MHTFFESTADSLGKPIANSHPAGCMMNRRKPNKNWDFTDYPRCDPEVQKIPCTVWFCFQQLALGSRQIQRESPEGRKIRRLCIIQLTGESGRAALSNARPSRRLSMAAKNGAILAGGKEPWCGLRNGLVQN